jgi:hypothetical protein
MPIKCSKCGADIPDGASFCPKCGASKSSVTPQSQQYNKRTMQPMGGGLEELGKTLFSTRFLIIGVLLGIFLVFIASLIYTITYPPDSNDILKVPSILSELGFIAISTALICGGIVNHHLNRFVRLAMVFIGVWLLVIVFGGPSDYLTNSFMFDYSNLFPY